mmetsp:Transcript_4666/g.6414  ORF Transcript_4666/g.6414 Transcript_4666/m.6414 type:complete len:262 (+) Transcript_4666:152-937(+)
MLSNFRKSLFLPVCRHPWTLLRNPLPPDHQFSSSRVGEKRRVALILSGCGVYDGSEIQEAVSCLVHLNKLGAEVHSFAPDMSQKHTIDHSCGDSDESGSRNVFVESARISRGVISKLDKLNASEFDALVIPGGFGAAKNLCSFAFDSADCKVEPKLEEVMKDFHSANKPIGLCCIAPVIAAKVFPGCEVTVGKASGDKWPYGGTLEAIKAMGSVPVEKDHGDVHIDQKNKIITAPAYMYEGTPAEIYDNVGVMIKSVLELA